MTTDQRRQIRAEAWAMTLEALREAHAQSIAMWASATTPEAAQYHHEAAGEYAEVYQRATHPDRT